MKSNRLELVCVLVAASLVAACPSYAQEKGATAGHAIVHPADLKWTPIMKGCEMAAVSGDPSAEGAPFTVRLRCAAGTIIPAHWHPTDENVTVLEGTFQVGMGDKYDAAKLETMSLGNFVSVPKEMRHFALSKTATIVQVSAIGPFKVNWVNPAEVVPPDANPAK